ATTARAMLVGVFEELTALEMRSNPFGQLPSPTPPIPPMYTVEPPQEGEIRFTLRRVGQLGLINIGWHIPEARHADTAALTVLDTMLSAGITSRLYQALVETQMAVALPPPPLQSPHPR